MNPFDDPAFRPKQSSLASPELRRQVETIIDRYATAAASAESSSDTTSGNPHLPEGGEPMDVLQINTAGEPSWLRKLTVSDSPPSNDQGEDGDVWIET